MLIHIQLFVTPWTVAHQGPLFMGFVQARILERVAMPSSRASSQPRYWIWISCIAGGFFTIWATREAQTLGYHCMYVIILRIKEELSMACFVRRYFFFSLKGCLIAQFDVLHIWLSLQTRKAVIIFEANTFKNFLYFTRSFLTPLICKSFLFKESSSLIKHLLFSCQVF